MPDFAKETCGQFVQKIVRKNGASFAAIFFQSSPQISPFCSHEVLQVTKQPDEREIPPFPSVCSALLPVVKVWEISSLLCSRNCALREAVDVVYTILYIVSLGTGITGNSNQIINLKTENDYGKERNVFGSGSRGSGGDG